MDYRYHVLPWYCNNINMMYDCACACVRVCTCVWLDLPKGAFLTLCVIIFIDHVINCWDRSSKVISEWLFLFPFYCDIPKVLLHGPSVSSALGSVCMNQAPLEAFLSLVTKTSVKRYIDLFLYSNMFPKFWNILCSCNIASNLSFIKLYFKLFASSIFNNINLTYNSYVSSY